MTGKRGRPMSLTGLLEEARVQAIALRQVLGRHDEWEASALAATEVLLARGDTERARRLVRELRLRDRWENQRHAEIDGVWREVGR